MTDPMTTPIHLPSDAPTVDAMPRLSEGPLASTVAGSAVTPPLAAAIVEGSAPGLTGETRRLLQSRLRVAAFVLGVAFAVFVVRHFFSVQFAEPVSVTLFIVHIAATIGLGVCARMLRDARPRSMPGLRAFEAIIFGVPTAFFIAIQYVNTLTSCQKGVLDFPEGLWLVLIYTYTIFIPNTWQRAAVVIGVMAATPMLLLFGMMWYYPVMAEHVTTDQIVGLTLAFCVCGVSCVFGVNIIGVLRREVFEARQLGQYRLTQRIGVGGMGEVFLAEHQLLKRPCVVKLIRPDKAGNPKNLARFQREVQATAKLSHWNTIEIFDYGCTPDGTFYYVMEYLPGMTLGELVERFGPMPADRVIYLLRQACDALGEAHAVGLLHRDIKPANIFAAQRGGVYDVTKLLDFGLVKPLAEEETIQITMEGAIAGSPLFMSPEQALGDANPDARSDIYSLGAVGYYLLTGRPPFEGTKPIKVMFAHAHEPVAPPSQHRADIPADLECVVLKCLAKSPNDRFQNAARLREALAACGAANGWNREKAAAWWHEKVG